MIDFGDIIKKICTFASKLIISKVNINAIIKKTNFNILHYSIIFSLLLSSCANIVSPTGGPQDKTPPKLLKSKPQQNETNFKSKQLDITFDEYIVLKEINNQLFISPPLENKPEIKVRGKSIIIELKEELIPNTTYIFNFGDAITDLHEGNPLSNFNLVFSTGDAVDSMSYIGTILDAFTSEPEKDAIVMLYEKTYDSIPYLEKPLYISKTDSKGNFSFTNIKNTTYKIIAITDLNKNLKYNPYVEKIAFETSLIKPFYIPPSNIDTNSIDTLSKKTFVNDTVNKNIMILFLESSTKQKILKYYFLTDNQAIVTFQKADRNIEIKNINIPYNQYVYEWNSIHDTLSIWLLKNDIDSLKITLSDKMDLTDSIVISKNKLTKKISSLTTTITPTNNISPVFDYFNKIKLTFPYPLVRTDTLHLLLIENLDTNYTYAVKLNDYQRTYEVEKELKQNTEYQVIIPNQEIQDICNKKTATLNTKFKTNSSEDFGTLTIDFVAKDTTTFYIIQIINEKNQIIEDVSIKGSKKLKFNNLKPGNYTLKSIVDENQNKKWDTGNYLQKIQPEKTFFFPSKINIKANWDLEERWIE